MFFNNIFVEYFSHKSVSLAEKMQAQNISIPMAIKTRWNSQYNTVCKTLQIPHNLLNDLLREIDRSDLVLTNRDINLLQEFANIFALFAEATTRTQAENSASISLVAPCILSIYLDLQHEEQNCKFLRSLCQTLLVSLRERFGGLLERCGLIDATATTKKCSTYELYGDDFYLIAPFLDGQFKMKWVDATDIADSAKKKTTDLIKTLVLGTTLQLHGSMNDSVDTIVELSPADSKTSSSETANSLPVFVRKRLFSPPDGSQLPAKRTRSSVSEMIQDEILLFMKESSDDTHLIFKKKEFYPHLHRLAVRVLSVPATSAPVERVFSSSGIIMRPHRSRLTKNMVATLTLLKCNRDLL